LFQAILEKLHQIEGVQSVVFADSEGEIVGSCGENANDELRLLGAYQGILLNSIDRVSGGDSRTIITVYEEKMILTHYLKDGYFISVILSPDANFSRVHFLFQNLYSLIAKEL
jgi:hypothetical protein